MGEQHECENDGCYERVSFAMSVDVPIAFCPFCGEKVVEEWR